MISEGGDTKDGRGGHERDQLGSDREANVVDAAMHALGAVARALPWHHYDTLLSQLMRAMKVRAARRVQEVGIRVRSIYVCAPDAPACVRPSCKARKERRGSQPQWWMPGCMRMQQAALAPSRRAAYLACACIGGKCKKQTSAY